MSEERKIRERIKKLLALAGSLNEAEAKAAMDKALELVSKYKLDFQKIAEDSSRYKFSDVSKGKDAKLYEPHVLDVLEGYFSVRAIYVRKTIESEQVIVLIGEPDDVKIATHVFKFLSREYPLKWEKVKEVYDAEEWEEDIYYRGLSDGVGFRIRLERMDAGYEEQNDGLVLQRKRDLNKFVKSITNTGIKRKRRSRRMSGLGFEGFIDGGLLEISIPIESKKTKKVLKLKSPKKAIKSRRK